MDVSPWRSKERYWLYALLFAVTFFTTTTVGARLASNFAQNRPAVGEDDILGVFSNFAYAFTHPTWLAQGLPFSLTLLTVLLAHEMGHYLTCRYYEIDASLPYFLPAPSVIGTLGAFIRIRAPIFYKRQFIRYRHCRSAGWLRVRTSRAWDRTGVFESDPRHRHAGRSGVQHSVDTAAAGIVRVSRRAGQRYLSPSHCARCLGRRVRYCAEPAAHWTTRWRSYSLFVYG